MVFYRINNFFKLVILLIIFCKVNESMSQTTYTVTSTSKDGPGSINEAITLANNNPGVDIIEFTPGLQVNAVHPSFSGNSNDFMIQITESVTIDGKGGAINGSQTWVSANGDINPLGACPGTIQSTTILRSMPNFIEIGTVNQDNSSITVTIKDLSIKQFNSIAAVRDNATLILEEFKADEIWSTLDCIAKGLIEISDGGTLTITNSRFTNSKNWASENLGTAIVSDNAEDLTIEETLFYNINGGVQFLLSWIGSSTADVNIISSRILLSGGFKIIGNTNETNIVNSTWVDDNVSTPKFGDRFINDSNGPMNFIASSLMWNSNTCNIQCQNSGISTLLESSNGSINFIESAVGFNFENTSGNLVTLLGGSGSGFSADTTTWIQPTVTQDETTLETITSQPTLLTGPDAFAFDVVSSNALFDADFLTPNIAGELIDEVSSTLLNPVTGVAITEDPLGNPREDANGLRDIGALQLSLAPFLSVSNIGETSVNINWNPPTHHNNLSIIEYEVSYAESGSSETLITVPIPNLSLTINGLTTGTTYDIKVRTIYDNGGSNENGPFSNEVNATPFGTLESPTLTATAGNTEVFLSWNIPDLGGRTYKFYDIFWRVLGNTEYIDAIAVYDINQTSATATGLTNGVTYEFSIFVRASGENSAYNFATATPDLNLGISENNTFTKKFSFYPNPTKNYYYIETNEDFKAKLFSITGNLLLDDFSNKVLDMSIYSEGVYFIQIEYQNKLYTKKIIKNQ